MQVFKLVFKVLKKNLGTVIMYGCIFFTLIMMITKFGDTSDEYTSTKIDVAIRDLDNTSASRQLVDWVSENHNIVDADFEDEDELLAKMYFDFCDYAITINEGFEEKLASGNTEDLFTVSKRPNGYSYGTIYFESQLNSIVSDANAYVAGGMTADEALQKTVEVLNSKTEVSFIEEKEDSVAGIYFNYMAYLLLSMNITVMSTILLVVFKKDITARTYCSSFSQLKYILQTIGAVSIISVGFWVILVLGSLYFDSSVLSSTAGLLMVGNSFVFLICSVEIAVIASLLVKSSMAVSAISNIASLGMAFLCGVFVPQNVLSDGVLSVGRFFPAYWYVKAIDSINGWHGSTYNITEIAKAIGIEAFFVVALMAVILVIVRSKRTQKSL